MCSFEEDTYLKQSVFLIFKKCFFIISLRRCFFSDINFHILYFFHLTILQLSIDLMSSSPYVVDEHRTIFTNIQLVTKIDNTSGKNWQDFVKRVAG